MEKILNSLVYHTWRFADWQWRTKRYPTSFYQTYKTNTRVQRWLSDWLFAREWAHRRCNQHMRDHHIEVE